MAVLEEVAFRGLILRYTELKLGSWPAIVLSAVLFGLWHLQNPDMTALSIVETASPALLLGAAYVLTRASLDADRPACHLQHRGLRAAPELDHDPVAPL